MILLIDNYDSFVYNLARYFQRLGHETDVVRNDALRVSQIRALQPEAIVLSPGPCTPDVAGHALEVVQTLWREIPMLGVCLGHQTIAAAFGAAIVRAGEPMHGRTSPIVHDAAGLFAGLPTPLNVCRYHSLVVDERSLPDDFQVTARLSDDTIMAIRHRQRPLMGVQFHPEAILTDCGYQLLANFLRLAGLDATIPAEDAHELLETPGEQLPAVPGCPITF